MPVTKQLNKLLEKVVCIFGKSTPHLSLLLTSSDPGPFQAYFQSIQSLNSFLYKYKSLKPCPMPLVFAFRMTFRMRFKMIHTRGLQDNEGDLEGSRDFQEGLQEGQHSPE